MIRAALAAMLLASPALADNTSYTATPTGAGTVINVTAPAEYDDTDYNGLTAGSVLDARGEVWRFSNSVHAIPWGDDPDGVGGCRDATASDPLPMNSYPLDIGGSDVWLQGGTVIGQVSWLADWDNHYCNSAAIVFDNPPTAAGIEGVRIDRAWDGIRFASAAGSDVNATLTIRDSWLSNMLDDAVENDGLRNIVVQDSLFESLGPSFLSMRPSPGWAGGSHRLTHTATITDTMVSFREYIAVVGGEGWRPRLIKADANMPALRMSGVVMALPKFPIALEGNWRTTWEALADGGQCSVPTNWFLWTADTPLPWLDPATANWWPFYGAGANTEQQCQDNPALSGCQPVPPCFAVKAGRAAREHWATARAAWLREHSDIPRLVARTLPDGTYVPGDPPGR